MKSQEKTTKQMRIFIPADLHKQLKLASVMADSTMADHVVKILRKELLGEAMESEDDSE